MGRVKQFDPEKHGFIVRHHIPDDWAYILDTFINTLALSRPWAKITDWERKEIYGEWLTRGLEEGKIGALMMVDAINTGIIVGYILTMERLVEGSGTLGNAVVWIHVRREWRGRGVARMLYSRAGEPMYLTFRDRTFQAWRARGIRRWFLAKMDEAFYEAY